MKEEINGSSGNYAWRKNVRNKEVEKGQIRQMGMLVTNKYNIYIPAHSSQNHIGRTDMFS